MKPRTVVLIAAGVGVVYLAARARVVQTVNVSSPITKMTRDYLPIEGGGYVPDSRGRYYFQSAVRGFWAGATQGTTIPDRVGASIVRALFGPAAKVILNGNVDYSGPSLSFDDAYAQSRAWSIAVGALSGNEDLGGI